MKRFTVNNIVIVLLVIGALICYAVFITSLVQLQRSYTAISSTIESVEENILPDYAQ